MGELENYSKRELDIVSAYLSLKEKYGSWPTQHAVAEYLGSNRGTVSGVYNRLKYKGVIEVSENHKIVGIKKISNTVAIPDVRVTKNWLKQKIVGFL